MFMVRMGILDIKATRLYREGGPEWLRSYPAAYMYSCSDWYFPESLAADILAFTVSCLFLFHRGMQGILLCNMINMLLAMILFAAV